MDLAGHGTSPSVLPRRVGSSQQEGSSRFLRRTFLLATVVLSLQLLPSFPPGFVEAARHASLLQAGVQTEASHSTYLSAFVKDSSGSVAVDGSVRQVFAAAAGNHESGASQPCQLSVATPAAPAHAGILAEPHKATNFVLSLSCEDGEKVTSWELFSEGPNGQRARGAEAAFTYTQQGHGKLKVSACPLDFASAEGCEPENKTQVFEVPLSVTYVRRNLQTLSVEERQRYFNGLKVLKNHTTEEGRKKFGSNFVSYNELASMHGAAVWVKRGECDFAHSCPALVTFHRAFNRLLEKSLQSVDPSLACHYWDYLKDGELAAPEDSFMFSEDYFGNLTGDPDNHYRVSSGQFVDWDVPRGVEAEILTNLTWNRLGPSHMVNPYGILRSPDNGNPSPYVTRFSTPSSTAAANYDSWLECANLTLLGTFIECLDYSSIHPGWHAIVGESANFPSFEDLKDTIDCSAFSSLEDCSTALELGIEAGSGARGAGVREGCLICPPHCTSPEQNVEECGCYCNPERREWCSPENVGLRFYSKLRVTPPALLQQAWEFVDYGMCTAGGFLGEYQDAAASALEPLFSSYHANLDRLLVAWRKNHSEQAWENLGFTYPSNDNRFFPDFRSTINILAPGKLYPGVVGPGTNGVDATGACEGQGLWDEIGGGCFVGVFDSIASSTMPHTNLQILETIDVELQSPATADYIYDSYEPVTPFIVEGRT